MKLSEISKTAIVEGGNIFKLPDGSPRTTRIALADIPATVDWLESITGLPLHNHSLGSVGKKSSSGDLDFVVDADQISKSDLAARLQKWALGQGLEPQDYVRAGAEVHFLTPIRGDNKNGYVQTDFFVENDPTWMQFSMSSPGDGSSYSGAERNQLMSSLAKAQGMKYSWKNGLLRREDDALISKDPEIIAQKLLGPRFTSNALDSVESIQQSIKNNSELERKLQKLIQDSNSPIALDPKTQQPVIDKKTGAPKQKPPGELRKTQEEAERITHLTGITA